VIRAKGVMGATGVVAPEGIMTAIAIVAVAGAVVAAARGRVAVASGAIGPGGSVCGVFGSLISDRETAGVRTADSVGDVVSSPCGAARLGEAAVGSAVNPRDIGALDVVRRRSAGAAAEPRAERPVPILCD
jgi:hypothetical protein